ncbi:MAG: methanol dehydrogenase [Gammaproteobacteria bacterium]|nr:methanol dehydrogenase [Gammaproteobacteria bacterium]
MHRQQFGTHSTVTRLSCVCLALACLGLVAADFPRLSGRVVDKAGLLDALAEQRISDLLAGHENATTNQVVVVTLKDLGGEVIEDYGYQLGRHWGIGQKDEDNGVLLIVAQKERKVRIEVGYGLEGTLTDAISANIIHTIIVPSFKKGKFAQGIEAGAGAIVQALGGQYKMKKKKNKLPVSYTLFNTLFIIFVIFISLLRNMGDGSRRRSGYYSSSGGFGGGGFGGGGGGFSGGGGGFGGGGASGGW